MDEIEALLTERDQLTKLSNELKYELQQARSHEVNCNASSKLYQTSPCQFNEMRDQAILDAILNDQSRSYDSESHESDNNTRVACIGIKPPWFNTTNSRHSKKSNVRSIFYFFDMFALNTIIMTINCIHLPLVQGWRPASASDRATLSQRHSFQRLINYGRKKQIESEKKERNKVRNWNIRD